MQPSQRGRFPKHHIAGPLALIRRPVVAQRILGEHLVVDGIELAGNPIQQPGPVHSQLAVHQLLRLPPVLHPGKAVVLPPVAQPCAVHLARQPFPPAQADLDGKRKPGLDARVHEPEHRVQEVVIQKQALELHPDKTRRIEFGRFAEQDRKRRGAAPAAPIPAFSSPDSCGCQSSSTAPRS
jgi:hypothetical protein